jgi:exodeoxyribonuclease V alpha subunit
LDSPDTRPPGTDQEAATLEGVIERIVFESEETGFVVGRLRREHAPELDTFVGNLLAVSPGETVRLRGRWVEDQKFGRQLRVESFETVMPSSVAGIEKYLGSGLIEGIGPKYAKRLVDAFGVETLKVIDEQPHRLQRVEGIGRKRAQQIREAWSKQKAIQSIMVFLQGHGIGTGQAVKIYKAYGDKAVTVLRQNPYRLAEDISGIAFAGADAIARKMGLAEDAPERLAAGVKHVLWQAMMEGHAYLEEPAVIERASEMLGVAARKLEAPLAQLAADESLRKEGTSLYLPPLYSAEEGVTEHLKRLVGSPHEPLTIHVENALKWVEQRNKIELGPEQRDAIVKGIDAKVMVITGGPGTGKTTVINSLLAILQKKGLSFLLCAPTGRAAKRMEDATQREARTIHRLLEFSPKQGGFLKNEANPLVTDLLIVDECSMIDLPLMHSLLRAIPPFARVILVGDVDQLPSVGPGNVLFDIIASGAVPVVRLETIFRQAAESGIVTNAHRINRGQMPEFNERDFFLIERDDTTRAAETVVELVTNRIPNKFGLDPFHEIQVLSPMRRGDAGVNHLNATLQEALNPRGAPVAKSSLRAGDKVMQLRNNYDLEVYNGDVGRIGTVDEEAKEFEVSFEDGRKVIYTYDDLDNLGLAYAATVHKSQGSEYPAVVLTFMSQHYMMLQRNLLYTAITRGKQLVVTVGDPKAIAMAVKNSKLTHRNTHLSERLRAER